MEILIVSPPAVAYGLSPLAVIIAAFTGNTLPVWGIIFIYGRWWGRYGEQENASTYSYSPSDKKETLVRLKRRARKIWDHYGLLGFSLLSPAVTGTHLAVIVALALKSPVRTTAFWMTVSLALWSVGLGVFSYYGLDWLGWF